MLCHPTFSDTIKLNEETLGSKFPVVFLSDSLSEEKRIIFQFRVAGVEKAGNGEVLLVKKCYLNLNMEHYYNEK